MERPIPVPTSELHNNEYTVGWICALSSEKAASEACLDDFHGQPQYKHPMDKNSYSLGKVGNHNVVIGCLPPGVDGLTSATVVAMHMLSSFPSMRFGLMVGIGGGAPKLPDRDIRLGDVVVSMPVGPYGGVMQYDYGKKTTVDGIERKGMLNKPPAELLNAMGAVRTNHQKKVSYISYFLTEMLEKNPGMDPEFKYQGSTNDCLFESDYTHVEGPTCAACDSGKVVYRSDRDDNLPHIHYGLIASGNLVWKESQTRDKLRDEYGILCFEMEAAGLMDSFPCLVIRGICDYADSHKNDRWQPYAAAVAAAYAKNLLYLTDSSQVINLSSVQNVTSQSISQHIPPAKEPSHDTA